MSTFSINSTKRVRFNDIVEVLNQIELDALEFQRVLQEPKEHRKAVLSRTVTILDLKILENGVLKEIFSDCKYLNRLDLKEEHLTIMQKMELRALMPMLEHLTTLNLSYTCLGDDGLGLLNNLLPPNLTSLILQANAISACGIRALKKLPEHLEVLDLSINDLKDEGLDTLGWILPQSLTTIDISDNFLANDGARALCTFVVRAPFLRNLFLRKNDIGSNAIRALGGTFPYMLHLQDLDLSHNLLGHEGARNLAEHLIHAPSLTSLKLKNNEIKDLGLIFLKNAAHQKLKYLDVSQNGLTIFGLQDFLKQWKYSQILQLVVKENPLGDSAVLKIRDALDQRFGQIEFDLQYPLSSRFIEYINTVGQELQNESYKVSKTALFSVFFTVFSISYFCMWIRK